MRQVERHFIKPKHKLYKEIDNLCFLSKNLYNVCVYQLRQHYFATEKLISFNKLYHLVKTTIDYKALPSKVSQLIVKQAADMFAYWQKALKAYEKNPKKFTGKPKLPKYKHKQNGRNKVTYNYQAISKTYLRQGLLNPSKTKLKIKTNQRNVLETRLIPKKNGSYYLEIVYEQPVKQTVLNNRYASIDIGLNNLATIGFNCIDVKPIIINGKAIKSCNRWFNKRKAYLQSRLPKNVYNSNRINRLSLKRENKISYYLHKSSKQIIDYLLANQISHLVIGKNDNWKQNINIGKKNNQNFTSVPHAEFINKLIYKAEKEGINVIVTEESYTSKTSFLDKEFPQKQTSYLGSRIKRGLFKSSKGTKINADLNGALQIMKKVVGNSVFNSDSILRYVVYPVRLSLQS